MYGLIGLISFLLGLYLGYKKATFDTNKYSFIVSVALKLVCDKHKENPEDYIKKTIDSLEQ